MPSCPDTLSTGGQDRKLCAAPTELPGCPGELLHLVGVLADGYANRVLPSTSAPGTTRPVTVTRDPREGTPAPEMT